MTHPLPDIVSATAERYLGLMDEHAPGVVEGLYVVGSAALGDFHSHTSDIDLVAVTGRHLRGSEPQAVATVHDAIREASRKPELQVQYLLWEQLGRPAPEVMTAPVFGDVDTNAVLWFELSHHAVALRGPQPSDLGIDVGHADLVAYVAWNVDAYWAKWLRRARASMRGRMLSTHPWGIQWGVTGVPRQLYSVLEGDVTSKTSAALYARERLGPRWHRIVDEAVRLRRGDSAGGRRYWSPLARRRDMLAFLACSIDETRAAARTSPLYGAPPS